MLRTGWSPTTIPYGADQTVYLVIDRFRSGSVYRETEIERTDLETIISDSFHENRERLKAERLAREAAASKTSSLAIQDS